jgi:glutathione peroxidase
MNFYQLSFKTPAGEEISMSEFKGMVVLIVNTATKCGFASQFEGLEKLHLKYKDKGLVVLGFPSNQFLNQEPETNESMVEACKVNFGVSFQLSEKIKVNGEQTHPVFVYLKSKSGGWFGKRIKWNFTKFLVNRDGMLYKRYAPSFKPKNIENDIIKLLDK